MPGFFFRAQFAFWALCHGKLETQSQCNEFARLREDIDMVSWQMWFMIKKVPQGLVLAKLNDLNMDWVPIAKSKNGEVGYLGEKDANPCCYLEGVSQITSAFEFKQNKLMFQLSES